MQYLIVVILLLSSSMVVAGGRSDCDRRCKPDGHKTIQAQLQAQKQKQLQAQQQGQHQGQNQNQHAVGLGLGIGYSNSKANADAQSNAKAKAMGGHGGHADSYSEGSHATGGASDASSNLDSNVYIDNGHDEAAATAASLYSQGCQMGGSGQIEEGGFSFIVDDIVCQSLKLADAHAEAIRRCPKQDSLCQSYHHEKVHHYLEVAGSHIDDTETTGMLAKNGINTGLAASGFGLLVYLLILL